MREQKPKPTVEVLANFFKKNLPGCAITSDERNELQQLYSLVSRDDLEQAFKNALKNHAMQPFSYMLRQLRVIKPEPKPQQQADPFNPQINKDRATRKRGWSVRVERGTDWREKYAEIRAKRAQEEQQYDQRHGPGSWRKKQDQECQQIPLGFIELEKHPATQQQEEVKGYDSWSDEDKAWYDNLIQGVFDEIKAEEQRRKEARQKELAKRRKQAEAHRKWKELAKNA